MNSTYQEENLPIIFEAEELDGNNLKYPDKTLVQRLANTSRHLYLHRKDHKNIGVAHMSRSNVKKKVSNVVRANCAQLFRKTQDINNRHSQLSNIYTNVLYLCRKTEDMDNRLKNVACNDFAFQKRLDEIKSQQNVLLFMFALILSICVSLFVHSHYPNINEEKIDPTTALTESVDYCFPTEEPNKVV